MRILLVDDHALFRDGVALLLRELDPAVQVRHASNVAEALAVLGGGAGIDLILLDFILPGMHGLQALETVRGQYPGVPLVMLSSQEDQATVLSSIRKVEELLKSDPEIAATVRDITSNINSKN